MKQAVADRFVKEPLADIAGLTTSGKGTVPAPERARKTLIRAKDVSPLSRLRGPLGSRIRGIGDGPRGG